MINYSVFMLAYSINLRASGQEALLGKAAFEEGNLPEYKKDLPNCSKVFYNNFLLGI
jgi:hypothetical protein